MEVTLVAVLTRIRKDSSFETTLIQIGRAGRPNVAGRWVMYADEVTTPWHGRSGRPTGGGETAGLQQEHGITPETIKSRPDLGGDGTAVEEKPVMKWSGQGRSQSRDIAAIVARLEEMLKAAANWNLKPQPNSG